jgi:hypothetical protein
MTSVIVRFECTSNGRLIRVSDTLGPFRWVHMTNNDLRTPNGERIATYVDREWICEDATRWSDLVIFAEAASVTER